MDTESKERMIEGMLLVIAAVLIVMTSYLSGMQTTGLASLDDASVFTGKDKYMIGDMVHIFITPKNVEYSLEVYGPDGNLVAVSSDFLLENAGEYRIKAIVSSENQTREITYNFTVYVNLEEMTNSTLEDIQNTLDMLNAMNETDTNTSSNQSFNQSEKQNITHVIREIHYPDIEFRSRDISEVKKEHKGVIKDIVELKKDGLKVSIVGADPKNIKNVRYKNGTFHIDSTPIDEATIELPHEDLGGVFISPVLYAKSDDGQELEPAKPHCLNKTIEERNNISSIEECNRDEDPLCLNSKNRIQEIVTYKTVIDEDNCFNNINITPTHYIFSVEHFSDYYVNTTGGSYPTLTDCLFATNNTADTCVINEPGYWDINGTYSFYFTGNSITIGTANMVLDCNSSIISGDGVTAGTGISYNRKGGNVTIKNCNVINFTTKNYDIDSYNDPLICTFQDSTGNGSYIQMIGDWNASNITSWRGTINLLEYNSAVQSYYYNLFSYNSTNIVYIDQLKNATIENFTVTSVNSGTAMAISSSYTDTIKNLDIDGQWISYPGLSVSGTDINITNATIKDIAGNCIDGAAAIIDNSHISNCSGKGINFGITGMIINNIIENCTNEGLAISGASVGNVLGRAENNTIRNCGNGTRLSGFKISNSSYVYNGITFNAGGITYPRIYNTDLSSNIIINTADKDVSSIATGSNNFSLWLIDLPGVGVRNWTLYMEQPYAIDCPTVAAAYSGTCYNYTDDYLAANGNSNYTKKDVSPDITINTATQDPAYLRYTNVSFQVTYPVSLDIRDNALNFTGNTIESKDGRQNYYSINVTGSSGSGGYSTNLWLNNLYTAGPYVDTGTTTSFCVNDEGNFYGENVIVPAGECGQSNITTPAPDTNYSLSINTTWRKQSSQKNISYYLYYSNNSGSSWYDITRVYNDTFYDWIVASLPNIFNYLFKVKPFDDSYNATAREVPNFGIYNIVVDSTDGGNFTSLEACLDYINNTEYSCVMLQDDYSETFSGAKDYSLGVPGNTDWNIDFANRKNVTIDFSNSIIRRQGVWEGKIFYYVGGHNNLRNLEITTQPGSVINYAIQSDNSGAGDYNETIYDNLIVYGDVQSAVHYGATGFGRQSLINSNISCISDECFRPYGEINITNSIISGGSAIKEFTGSVTIDNSSFINGARLILTDPTTDGSIVNSYFTDRIQNNNYYGSMNITNNTFVNIIEYNALDLSFIGATNSNNNNVINNTFINCGNDTYGSALKISNTTYNYLGEDFNDYTPLMLKSDIATSVTITTADTDVSAMTNGTANFSLWLLSLPGLGIGNTTFYVEQPYLMDCAAVAGAYGGICYNYTDDYLIGNGATSNYTIRDVSPDITIVAGTQDPAYLRFVNITIHNHFAINLSDAQRTNITGNTFKGCTDCSPIGYTNGGTSYEVAVWLNNFYVNPPYDSDGVIIDYCANNEGNFYKEGLIPMDGDCGQANFTNPANSTPFNGVTNGSIMFNWTNQSSNIGVSYYLFMYNSSENLIANVSSNYYNLTMTHNPYGNYTFRVMPNQDGVNGTSQDLLLPLISCNQKCAVNSTGGDFPELTQCLDYFNNTINSTCILNEPNREYNITRYHELYNLTGGYGGDAKINITADNVSLNCNDSIIRQFGAINSGHGIYMLSRTNVTIQNCNITGFNYDIRSAGVSYNFTIRNINSSCFDELVHFDNGTNILIERNNIINKSDNLSYCFYPINVAGSNITVRDNRMSNAIVSVSTGKLTNSTIWNNTIYLDNTGSTFPSSGIRFASGSSRNLIAYNNISGAKDCILFQSGVSSLITYNNITNNSLSCVLSSINITKAEQTNNTIWLNSIYRGNAYNSGTNTLLCLNGDGNFYNESITPLGGDCGQSNITRPAMNGNYTGSINTTWRKQSSFNNISYYLYYSNTSGASWNYITRVYDDIYYNWSIAGLPEARNYSFKVIPFDSYSNATNTNITNFAVDNSGPVITFINQTPSNVPNQSVNDTASINPNQNLTIRVNATDLFSSISSVWIKIWQTVKSAGVVLWEGAMSLVGGVWQIEIPVNFSYPGGLVNYTIFANDTQNITTELEGNFSINRPPVVASLLLNATSSGNDTLDNLTAYPSGISDQDGNTVVLNYNWYKNGTSYTVINMPMTAPDRMNLTYDFSGYGNHGNVSNGTVWNATGGYDGSGDYQFDAVNDYIRSNLNKSMIGDNLTISLWVRPMGAQSTKGILQVASTANSPWILLQRATSTTTSWFVNGNYQITETINDNNWYHLAITYDGSVWRAYKNGVEDGTYTGARGTNAGGSTWLGYGYNGYFNGSIDDFRIYNRSLSANEIALLYGNITNMTHSSALTAGDNWTAKVTPIDSLGLNGTSVFSNGLFVLDGTPPTSSNPTVRPSNPALFVTNQSYQFNVSWTDNVNLTGVLIEHNFTGTMQNYSITGNVSTMFYYNYTNITGGSYSWRMIANDSSGNYNATDPIAYFVDIPPALTSVLLNATSALNRTGDNLTAYPSGITDSDGNNVFMNYNWYKNGTSDTLLNMPFTAPDSLNKTYDFSGYGYHGNITNATWNATGGYNGYGAYQFDGRADFISIGGNTITGTSPLTISAWIKTNTVTRYSGAVSIGNSAAGQSAYIGTVAAASVGTSNSIGGGFFGTNYGSGITTLNEWRHVVFTFSGGASGNAKLYVDGVLKVNTTVTPNLQSANRSIGRIGVDPQYDFNGTVDDVRIYNRSLSANEILLLYGNMTNVTHSDATEIGDNWTVKATPIDSIGINGSDVFSNNLIIISNNAPTISSVLLNATSASNKTSDNLTAYVSGISDADGDSVTLNYNWYRNGISDTVLNMPFTANDSLNRTYDLSENGYHGNVTNGAFWNSTGGHDGFGAFVFDATNDYIILPSGVNIASSNFTMSAWFKVLDNRTRYVISFASSTSNNPILEIYTNNTVGGEFCGFARDDSGAGPISVCTGANDGASDGRWHHGAFTRNGSNYTVYLDGQPIVSENSSLGTTTLNTFRIGVLDRLAGRSGYFNGTIDDVRIYNRSLSANEVALLYSNITNMTHADATAGGDNWTVKVTPIDSYGLNGSAYFSNGVNVTEMTMQFVNQTNPAGQIINETNPIMANQNLTIRFNISNIGGSISSVWIKIWETAKSAGNVLWEGAMSLVGGLWQAEVPVDYSYPGGIVNYTVYVNDSVNITTELDGNFSVGCYPCYVNSSGGDFKYLTECMNHINNTNQTCAMNEQAYYSINGTYAYNLSGGAMRITAGNATLYCNNSLFIGINSSIGVSVEANNVTVLNCSVFNFGYGIYMFNVSYSMLSGINSSVNYNDNIRLNSSSYNIIQYSNLSGSQRGNGIELYNSSYNNLTYSTFSRNNYSTAVKTTFTSNLFLNFSSYNNILNNTMTYSGYPASINMWTNSSYNLIADNNIQYSYDHAIGIYAYSLNNTIYNNNLSNNHDAAINMKTGNNVTNNLMYSNEEGGMIIDSQATDIYNPAIVVNNTISHTMDNLTEPGDHGVGIWISVANDVHIMDNTIIESNNMALYSYRSTNVTVENNSILNNNFTGMRIATSNHINITGNLIFNNSPNNAMILLNCNDSIISNNTIINNSAGILLESFFSGYNNVTFNTIENNTVGINCTNGTFNNFTGNYMGNNYDFVLDPSRCSNNLLWLNNFHGGGVNDTYINNTYCVGGEGNFYNESLTPISGDCGQANFTYPLGRLILDSSGTFAANWTRQSSINTITYDIIANRTSDGIKTKFGDTTGLNSILDPSSAGMSSGNYTLLLVPWVDSPRINATNAFGGNLVLDAAPSLTSVLLNATSPSNHTDDNLTAYASGISDADGDPVTLNYNWIRNGVSDTVLNMPFTAPDLNNQTYDLSGNDNHGAEQNGAAFNSTAGHDGFGAYEFDGLDDFISVQNSASLNFSTQPFSVEAWVYKKGQGTLSAGNGFYNFVSKARPAIANENITFILGMYNEAWGGIENVSVFGVSDGSNLYVVFGPALSTETWYHIVGVWNSTDMLLYVDSNLAGSASAPGPLSSPDFNITIGGFLNDPTYSTIAFNGTIDDVRIYNRSLSANEVALLYNGITNITHADATTAPDNWTVKVTPIDSYGLNGSAYFSNTINITEMFMEFVNQTNNLGETINDTNAILANQNLTIRLNASNLGGQISSVWVVIWQTVESAGNILWQGLMSLVGGIWQATIQVNESWPNDTLLNYTIYANDSVNKTYSIQGNFTVNDVAVTTCRNLTQANTVYYLQNNVSSNKSCFNITANNITLDCRGYEVNFSNSKGALEFAPGIMVYSNNSVVRNCRVARYTQSTGYGYGIYLAYVNNTLLYNNTVFTRNYADFGVVVTFASTYTNMTHNTVMTEGGAASAVLMTANSSYGIYEYNNIITNNSLGWAFDVRNSAFNTFRNNTMLTRVVAPFRVSVGDNPEYYANVSIDTSNLAYGKPVNYTWNKTNWAIDSANMSMYGQVHIVNSSNINITNSEFTNTTILLNNVNHALIKNNTIKIAYGDGIYGGALAYSNITNNTINISSLDGGGIASATYSSDYMGIENNTIYTNGRIYSYGIHISYSNNNSIVNNLVLTEGYESPALMPEAGNGNIIRGGNYTTTNRSTASTALYLAAAANLSMYDVVLNGVNQNDTSLWQTSASIVNMTNCTLNRSKIYWGSSILNNINFFNYLDGQVNDSMGNMITGAAVFGYDLNSTIQLSTNTTAGGIIPRQQVLDYQARQNGITYYNNYTINASYDSRTNASGAYNISQNMNITLTFGNNGPTLASVLLNATSLSNHTDDNLTAYVSGIIDPESNSVTLNYNWYKNGVSDTVLNMPFTANDSNGQTYDLSGYGNNGNVTNATWNSTAGQDGSGAFEFDEKSYLNVTPSSNFPTTEGSISLWARFGAWNNFDDIIDMNNGGQNFNRISFERNNGFGICTNPSSNGIHFIVLNGTGTGGAAICTNTQFQTGSWYHIVGTWNSTTISVYVNGTLDNNGTAPFIDAPALPADEVIVGGTLSWSDRLFNGTIDEVRIYNRSLSANEVALLYNGITNITHADATTAPDNWTVKVTPIDSYGLNGSAYFSNGINITEMTMQFVNQTDPSMNLINETNPIMANQNLTINFNISNIGGSISSVWIKIWLTVASAGDVLWQGLMSLVGGVWQVNVTVNESYLDRGLINYTVYVNDTAGKEYNLSGNFSVSGIAVTACRTLNKSNTIYTLTQNITSSGTCITVNATNVTVDGAGHKITYGTGSSNVYGVYISGYNHTSINNFTIIKGGSGGSNHAIYLINSSNNTIGNNTLTISSGSGHGIYLTTSSSKNIIGNNIITDTGDSSHGIYLTTSSASNTISNNTITVSGQGTSYGIYINTNSNNISANKVNNLNYASIYMDSCTGNNLTSNEANSSYANSYMIYGFSQAHYNQAISRDNLAEGKPVNFTYNQNNAVYDSVDFTEYGQVIFSYCNNITLRNSNFSDDAISFLYTRNSTISGNIINASKGFGIYIFGNSKSNNITDNTITTSQILCDGIYIFAQSTSNMMKNNTITTTGANANGIYVYFCVNTTIDNNTVSSNYRALELHLSNNSIVSNNYITTNGTTADGIFMQSMHLVNITNTNINTYGNNSQGIYIQGGIYGTNNMSISGMNIFTNATGSNSIYIRDNNNNLTMRDSVLNSTASNTSDLYIWTTVSNGTWNLINVTFTDKSWDAAARGTLDVRWYLDAYANYSTGLPASGVNITAFDKFNSTAFTDLTGAGGTIAQKEVTEYRQNGSAAANITYYSNYTFNASLPLYTKLRQAWNMTMNRNLTFTFNNTPPSNVTLISPTNMNMTVFNRTPMFMWNAATDADSDSLTYIINITQDVCPNILVGGITATNYTPTDPLCLDVVYNWTVYASDGKANSTGMDVWGFQIASALILTLTTNTSNFGSVSLNNEYNTSYAGAPADPLIVQNDGNTEANVVKVAANTSLWRSVGLNTDYFQFKANNRTTKQGSFDWLTSITTWTNIPNVSISNATAISMLNYTDTNDTAEIDIRIKVPSDEPSGSRSSTLIITGEMV